MLFNSLLLPLLVNTWINNNEQSEIDGRDVMGDEG